MALKCSLSTSGLLWSTLIVAEGQEQPRRMHRDCRFLVRDFNRILSTLQNKKRWFPIEA
jgi:hypothetical protein